MAEVVVRRRLEYRIEVPSGLDVPPEQAALEEAKISTTAEADTEEFEVVQRAEEMEL